ncbi:transglutaminase-like putative cysteine protease [Leifsonia sp. AK011]|uniref:transglutaminase family protein n=1 Tax=Leifsonia sp. AK011 TaxID=2723075 RepID=UPI0015C88636|nr:DUF3488 and transglutaminase-like domain-containing protein [Leifsonia sp. AK011]NYF11294.1 transglutaminase-like putative cysteine protease [Leifsonia sp. AK011]
MAESKQANAPLSPGTRWLTSGLTVAAIGIALWGLHPVFDGTGWWLQGVVLAALVVLGATVVRSFARRRVWGTVAAVVVAILAMTLMFVASTAILGIVPTWDSFLAFRALDQAGNRDIATQVVPAEATEGIRFLVCLGVAVVAVLMDALAQLFRAPALAGLPLLVLLLVPSFVRSEFVDPAPFVLAGALWLAMIAAQSATPRTAIGVGAIAVVAAFLAPLALPTVTPPSNDSTSGAGGGFASGINPMITLGDDLRQGNPTVALTYRTSDGTSEYLRMTVLTDFSGQTWAPTVPEPGADVEQMGPPPGLGDGVPLERLTTQISVASILSTWLPVPYAAESVRGLEGTWTWEPEGLTVRAVRSNAEGQAYQVDSVQAQPSVQQLTGSGSGPFQGMDEYLELPNELPQIVRDDATEVTAGAESNYDKALALQEYFRGGEFTYSEETPVAEGFDGSGAEALGPFLEVKSGYCVHFSSAMAAMARSLGIPARVVVGFTPGDAYPTGENGEATAYRVSTDNLHAWPELYFGNIGWVRFEPTPGRGSPPAFAPLDADDPTTPDVDESVPPPPAPAPTPTATPSAAPDVPDDTVDSPVDQATSPSGTTTGSPWPIASAFLALLVLASPALVRLARRTRRLSRVRQGSAIDGWDELRDIAYDLGIPGDVTLTPQQLASVLAPHLDDDGAASLARFRASLESQAYAREGTAPSVPDLRRVLRSLRRRAGLARSLGATVVPLSLVREWLPARQ